MKKFLTSLISMVLLCSVISLSFAAADDITQTAKYATPTIDGIIDDEYKESLRIEHRWSEKDNSDSGYYERYAPGAYGKYAYDSGYEYDWDCSANSYFLWDRDNLYIAIEVTDDDYGCLDDEAFKYAEEDSCTGIFDFEPQLYQDSVQVLILLDGEILNIRADRAGRFISANSGKNYNDSFVAHNPDITEILTWEEDHAQNMKNGYYAVTETATGYIAEMKIPISDSYRSKLLYPGNEFSYGLAVVDSDADSRYYWGSSSGLTDDTVFKPYLIDTVSLLDGIYHNPVSEKTECNLPVTLEGTLLYGDINWDEEVNSKDLTRLMKTLSGEMLDAYSADLNGDKKINSKDVVCLMKFLAANSKE